ncbi:SufE family protein [Proteiniphilum sp.]|uniref:SufE family protein n=1 Tax=Proteiniphilum sp. TaxID=1926877 RepID=UPI002B203D70|nr:SufE family protein [Proteiniphilum sp.]MEA4918151.1 SufE family protein [Proteiniphilum sp.]
MTLKDYQDLFVDEFALFDQWSDKYNLLIEYADSSPRRLTQDLLRHRISNCLSRTYFRAENIDGMISIEGWSNSSIMHGLIVYIKKMFHNIPVQDLREVPIDFHVRSGLVDHVTPFRKAAILEIIERINVLLENKT